MSEANEEMDWLTSAAGQGFENMGANCTSTAYLSMVQPGASIESEATPAGTWVNTATGRSYGETVKVAVIAFRTIWTEREPTPPFRTVGRYLPNSIHVETRMPPKGQQGYPKMINPDTGYEVQELFVYAVILPEYPEDGVLIFNPVVGNMKMCRSWNSQLKGQLLPNGAQAPIFGYQWYLQVGLIPNPQQPKAEISRLIAVKRAELVNKELFTGSINPVLQATKQQLIELTPGKLEEPTEE